MPKDLLATQIQPRDLLGARQAPISAPAAQPSQMEDAARKALGMLPGAGMVRGAQAFAEDPMGTTRGAFRGLDDEIRAIAEGATFGFADEFAAAMNAALGQGTYEENLAAERARDAAIPKATRVAGNVVGGLALAPFVPTAAVSTVPRAIATGAGAGALSGAGFDEEGDRLKAAGRGAMTGAATAGALGALGRVISPKSTPAIQALRREGVEVTPGQAAGGIAKTMEEKAVSIPFAGDLIRGRMKDALESFNQRAINFALRPAGVSLKAGTKAGRAAIGEAQDALSSAYDKLLKPVKTVRFDNAFRDEMTRIVAQAKNELPDDAFKMLTGRIRRIMKGSQKKVNGEVLNEVRSDLGKEATKFQQSAAVAERDIADILRGIQSAVDDLASRNMSPDAAAALRGVRQAYANMTRVERAAAAAGSKEGVFTPAALRAATKALDTSVRKRGFARGNALMQKFAEQGEEVLGATIPNSGTADRGLASLGILGATAVEPMTLAGVAATGAPYASPQISQTLSRLISGRQGPGAQAMRTSLQSLIAPGAIVAAEQ